jgi:hypothetical protein
MTEATCTSTDPTNHQGDTCPVHEQEATQRPWGYVHHKGLDQHLVGATLENVAIVEDRHGNAKENAEFIVKAVNSHDALVVAIEDMEESRENLEGLVQRLTIQNDALVAALEAAYYQLPCVCGDNFETCDCAVAKVTAALSEAVK